MEKRKTVRIALAIAGITGILIAILIDPDFAKKYLSSDNHITLDRIKDLQYYRILSILYGCLLLASSFLVFKIQDQNLKKFTSVALLLVIVAYLMLFGYNAMTRTHDFRDPDTMNFVDVARNIATGRGIAQSTLGFNQKSFSVDDPIPVPLTAQPPLYPLLIALLGWLGMPCAESGLLISNIAYGLILLMAYRLSLELYDQRAALLSVCFLIPYSPLREVCGSAFSEPLGIVLLLSFMMMLTRLNFKEKGYAWVLALCGLICGLVFATRYALLPLFAIGILFILFQSKRKLADLSLYTAGFALPAGLVLARNLYVSGAMMPTRNPSNIGFIANVLKSIEVIAGEYARMLKPELQATLLIVALLMLAIPLIRHFKLIDVLQNVFINERRYLLTLWCIGYVFFLIFTRTRVHFDTISSRLIVPAGVFLVLFFAAFIVRTIKIKTKYIAFIVFFMTFLMIQSEIRVTIKKPAYDKKQYISNSERLSWVAQNTTKRDFIICSGAVDIPFYLNRPATLSFQYYPENDVLEYKKIMEFCNVHGKNYDNIYMIFGAPSYRKLQALTNKEIDPDNYEANLRIVFGSFLTDILLDLNQYKGVTPLRKLDNERIYLIDKQEMKI